MKANQSHSCFCRPFAFKDSLPTILPTACWALPASVTPDAPPLDSSGVAQMGLTPVLSLIPAASALRFTPSSFWGHDQSRCEIWMAETYAAIYRRHFRDAVLCRGRRLVSRHIDLFKSY